jgi:hypothetical protein
LFNLREHVSHALEVLELLRDALGRERRRARKHAPEQRHWPPTHARATKKGVEGGYLVLVQEEDEEEDEENEEKGGEE